MRTLRYTLVADGSSDRCLLRVIDWVLRNIDVLGEGGFVSQMADFRGLDDPPVGLRKRVLASVDHYPCDLIFVHRDAESICREDRVSEIHRALLETNVAKYVPVIPVRMTEAWLLIDEGAIRSAADNPNGTVSIDLPPLSRLDSLPDPKLVLRNCLLDAHASGARRREQYKRRLPRAVHRVAELIDDFSPLRQLDAFQTFETEARRTVESLTRGEFGGYD